jgi:DNA-binding winged helix-turn-helix (wHTH) protein
LSTSRHVTFGQFHFDLLTGELRKSDRRIPLAEQSAQVLRALLERAGDLVTRDELRERL